MPNSWQLRPDVKRSHFTKPPTISSAAVRPMPFEAGELATSLTESKDPDDIMHGRFKHRYLDADAGLAPEAWKRLAEKSKGSSNFKKGAAYECGYVAYRAILLARDLNVVFSLRDDVECFVDDLVIQNGPHLVEFCQAKSGEIPWKTVLADVALQWQADGASAANKTYKVVVSHDFFTANSTKIRDESFVLEAFGADEGRVGFIQVAQRHPEMVEALQELARTQSPIILSSKYKALLGHWISGTAPLDRAAFMDSAFPEEALVANPFEKLEPDALSRELAGYLSDFDIKWEFTGRFLRCFTDALTLHVLVPFGTAQFEEFACAMRDQEFECGWDLMRFIMKYNARILEGIA